MTTPPSPVPGATPSTDFAAGRPVQAGTAATGTLPTGSASSVGAQVSGADSAADTPTVRQFFRRNTFWILLGIVALGVVLLSAILRGGATGTTIPLAADSPAPDGARAAIEVL